LFYHLYNLVSHRLSLLNIVDKLVMVTSGTHAIAKKGYSRRRPIRLNKSQSLRYTIPRTLGQVVDDLLRKLLQPHNQGTAGVFG